MRPLRVASGVAALVMASVAHGADVQPAARSDIAWALSAAPASIAAGAAVVTMSATGEVRELREGMNGWTCIVHDPGAPVGYPMCLDRNGLAWMMAAMSGKAPDPDKVGYSYMLRGGTGWSNTDIGAVSPPPGQKDFLRVPPHVMIMNARIANSSGFPSGEEHPDTHKPFVIYGGTPFAILILPLK